MELTFEEAIENHRKMWNWISDETEKRKRIITKEHYFKENKIIEDVFERCFCCEYGGQKANRYLGTDKCEFCPLYWGVDNCEEENSPYENWKDCQKIDFLNWKLAAKYAREIANLPARKL